MPSNKPLGLKLDKLQSHYGLKTPDEVEDVVPYDPNSGTLTNIGRFMLNNLATDQGLGGAMPVAGSVKAVTKAVQAAPKEAINIPLIAKLMGKTEPAVEQSTRLFGDNAATSTARTTADITADMAQNNLANAVDVAKTQQQLSRAVDMQQRSERYAADRLKQAKLRALKK